MGLIIALILTIYSFYIFIFIKRKDRTLTQKIISYGVLGIYCLIALMSIL